jgi:uncharacterized protein (DUF4415 family)
MKELNTVKSKSKQNPAASTGPAVKFTLKALTPHSAQADELQARMRSVADLPDAAIDYSDIPAHSTLPAAVQWTRPGALLPMENKLQVTLRLDADVLVFFKGTGKRYQSRINAALREYMNAHA